MKFIRIHPRLRRLFSRLSSLLLLFQRSPIIQLIFPEAKILGSSAIADTATLAIATIVGLGAFDSVAGASNSVVQTSPVAGSSTVNATVGVALTFVYGIATSDTPTSFTITSGTLPSGLIKSATISAKKNYISGTPAAGTQGSYPITIKASDPKYSTTGTFTIVVAAAATTPPAITTNPSSTTINSGSSTILNVTATGTAPLTYKWYEGAAGVTTNLKQTGSTSSFTTPTLTATTSYWVNVSNAANPNGVNSTAATVTVPVPAAIASQPYPASNPINYGATTTLSVVANGSPTLTYQWYMGNSGDLVNSTKILINGTSASYTTPALTTTTNYWVNVINPATPAGVASYTATVYVLNPFQTWMALSGTQVPSNQTDPGSTPQPDGLNNMQKFAFNMDPNKSDSRRLRVGSGDLAGLPGFVRINGKLRLEYIRRKASTNPGITYLPQCTTNLAVWTPFPGAETATPIGTTVWERVVVDGPAGESRCLGRVMVETP